MKNVLDVPWLVLYTFVDAKKGDLMPLCLKA